MSENTISFNFGTISIEEFAKSIGKPTSTIYSWKRNGNIPKECFAQIGKCIFVLVEPMKQFLNRSAEVSGEKHDNL